MSIPLPIGKLPSSLLEHFIQQLPTPDSSVIVPPGIGLDAAGIHAPHPFLSVTTDPITFSSHELGTYSLCVNINDIACSGSKPRWYTASLLLPFGTTLNDLQKIWDNLVEALKKYQVQAIGGHIEVTETVNTPVIVGQLIGEALSNRFLTPKDGKPGDQIFVCRPIAIEGTALLAKERETFLKKHLSTDVIERCQNLLKNPGICVWPVAEPIIPIPGLVALHDPTEGGIATALHELADAAQCGLTIDPDSIPILDETKILSQILSFNPLGLLASGSLLILCRPEMEATIRSKLPGEEIAKIGELTNSKERIFQRNGRTEILPRFNTDEITRALGRVIN